jgi:hypothetical protein
MPFDVVGAASDQAGRGLLTVDVVGHVFPTGTAPWAGNWEGETVSTAVVARPQGDGYWIVATDGSVQAIGGAPPFDAIAVAPLSVTDARSTPSGNGLIAVMHSGRVLTWGDAVNLGDGTQLGLTEGAVAIIPVLGA